MNRLVYFLPLTSLPLLALAERSAHNPAKADNPYIAALLIAFVALALAVTAVSYFRLHSRGRIITGIVFGAAGWIITISIMVSAGVIFYLSLGVATVSACLIALVVIRFSANLASFFGRYGAPEGSDD